ncbi:MAG: acyl-CoA thioesterase [Desulfobacterota bacterium]|nr:acyl-CoA thioesterase [Thermodesulfobacteriota bacterium]
MKQWLETEVKVRFEEVDPWQIVWYGNYLSYFEVGRTALLEKFQLLADDITDLGFRTPVVDLKTRFKTPARFNDRLLVWASVRVPETASLIFDFEIHRPSDRALIARGETTQVLLDLDGKMIYRFSGPLKDRVERMVAYCNP